MAVNSSSGFISNMFGLFDEVKSIEAEDRFGLQSSVFVTIAIILYLLFVYKIGPSFMQNRQPYKLKGFIAVYNISQVVACIYLIKQVWLLTGWNVFSFSKCIFYEPNTPGRKLFDDLTYFTFWLKIIEFTDTVIFVLRKKQNQITYLHVFHHSSTLTLIYLLLRYDRGNGALYPILINSCVHVIMYSYYFLSNVCGPEVLRRLVFIKKSITIIQMIQFVFILTQATIMGKNCKIPVILIAYYCFVVVVFFYGFYDFYKKAYLRRQHDKMNIKQS